MSQAPSETTRGRVLRLADGLFAAHGYAAVSMREVATAAGVTKPALYYHFRDKEALFEECILASQQHLGELIRQATTGGRPLPDRVSAVALVLLTGSPHRPVRAQADAAEHLPAEARQRVSRSWHEQVLAPVSRLFEEARPALREGIEPAQASMALLGVSMAYLPPVPASAGVTLDVGRAPARTAPTPAPEAAAALIGELVLRGVAR